MSPCLDLTSFADGELEPERAAAFRVHLETCDACRADLIESLQLSTRLAALAPAKCIASAAERKSECLRTRTIGLGPEPSRSGRGCAQALVMGAVRVLVPMSLAMVLLCVRSRSEDPFADQTTRPREIRFAYAGAAEYRRRNELRGESPHAQRGISRTMLAELEQRDRHALALALAWNGDLVEAVAQLRGLAQSPQVRSDRAAVEFIANTDGNFESVLAELEALRDSSDVAAARAARWNRALVLARLDLPLGAARAFHTVADEHEAGWAAEAQELAECKDRHAGDAWRQWNLADAAGKALVATGEPVPTRLIEAVPGVLRAHFYDAVRTAPSRERVLALASPAAALDELTDQRLLGEYVQRVAKLDFERRARLASGYARMLRGEPIPLDVEGELTTPTDVSDDVADIVMGAMVERAVVTEHLASFERMAKQAGDPWFEIVYAQAAATVDVRRDDWRGAESRLRRAQKQCAQATTYPCLSLDDQLGALYVALHRIPEAREVLAAAVQRARRAGEWRKTRELLGHLASAEQLGGSPALAQAHADEAVLMDR